MIVLSHIDAIEEVIDQAAVFRNYRCCFWEYQRQFSASASSYIVGGLTVLLRISCFILLRVVSRNSDRRYWRL